MYYNLMNVINWNNYCEGMENHEMSWFYIGYTHKISDYLLRTGPKSQWWRMNKQHFIKVEIRYAPLNDDLTSESTLTDMFNGKAGSLDKNAGNHKVSGIVYVVLYYTKPCGQQPFSWLSFIK